ncbi:hypothetical protein B1R27_16035 [Streptomyces sp. GKU 895]|nr:hypothetical protein B1R27_16035 [Streptomyces sp. GKU 895]
MPFMSGSARAAMTSRLRSTLTSPEHSIWFLATAVVEGRPVAVAVAGSRDVTVRIWDFIDGRRVGGLLVDPNGLIRTGEVWSLAPLDHSIGRMCEVATTVLDRRPVAVPVMPMARMGLGPGRLRTDR